MKYLLQEGSMLLRLRRLLKSAGRDVTQLYYACRNPQTPRAVKLAAGLLLVYLISPFDLVPEVVPVFGLLDDITLAAFAIPALLRRLPQSARMQAEVDSEALLRRLAFWR
jgi:uncharacterized membrane protein YkvA (DUF1232 family)